MNQLHNIVLEDPNSTARAEIVAGLGFNCHRLRLEGVAGQGTEIFRSEPNFGTLGGHPTGSGLPIMFPFPGRILGGRMTWQGRTYELPDGDGLGNAIHGFVLQRPWRVLHHDPLRAEGEFHAAQDAPELLDQWPSDFRIVANYQLNENRFHMTYRVSNPGQTPLPCGLGIHPYFRLPLGPRGDAESCTIKLPVNSTWDLDQLIATGGKQPLPRGTDYQQGLPFRQIRMDGIFSDLQGTGPQFTAEIIDHANQCRLSIDFDRTLRECIVYTPADRQAICIEPISCVPDPVRLAEKGVDTGLLILPPGGSFEYHLSLGLHPVPTGN